LTSLSPCPELTTPAGQVFVQPVRANSPGSQAPAWEPRDSGRLTGKRQFPSWSSGTRAREPTGWASAYPAGHRRSGPFFAGRSVARRLIKSTRASTPDDYGTPAADVRPLIIEMSGSCAFFRLPTSPPSHKLPPLPGSPGFSAQRSQPRRLRRGLRAKPPSLPEARSRAFPPSGLSRLHRSHASRGNARPDASRAPPRNSPPIRTHTGKPRSARAIPRAGTPPIKRIIHATPRHRVVVNGLDLLPRHLITYATTLTRYRQQSQLHAS